MVSFQNCFYELDIDPILSSYDFKFIVHASEYGDRNKLNSRNKRSRRKNHDEETAVDEAEVVETVSYRILAPYHSATEDNYAFQKAVGDLFNIKLGGGSWRWHHVVTKYHLKRLYPGPTVERMYLEEIPTVLIHQDTEHIDYNLLQSHGVHEAFDLPKENKVLTGSDRTAYIKKLKNLYFHVYELDDVLYKVARNILNQL